MIRPVTLAALHLDCNKDNLVCFSPIKIFHANSFLVTLRLSPYMPFLVCLFVCFKRCVCVCVWGKANRLNGNPENVDLENEYSILTLDSQTPVDCSLSFFVGSSAAILSRVSNVSVLQTQNMQTALLACADAWSLSERSTIFHPAHCWHWRPRHWESKEWDHSFNNIYNFTLCATSTVLLTYFTANSNVTFSFVYICFPSKEPTYYYNHCRISLIFSEIRTKILT